MFTCFGTLEVLVRTSREMSDYGEDSKMWAIVAATPEDRQLTDVIGTHG